MFRLYFDAWIIWIINISFMIMVVIRRSWLRPIHHCPRKSQYENKRRFDNGRVRFSLAWGIKQLRSQGSWSCFKLHSKQTIMLVKGWWFSTRLQCWTGGSYWKIRVDWNESLTRIHNIRDDIKWNNVNYIVIIVELINIVQRLEASTECIASYG